jgi:hypothetical protein
MIKSRVGHVVYVEGNRDVIVVVVTNLRERDHLKGIRGRVLKNGLTSSAEEVGHWWTAVNMLLHLQCL